MPFSHHSHSGQFCGHAENTLEEVVKEAIKKKMTVFALTEHMPREHTDLYPEEIEQACTQEELRINFDDYYHEARRLQNKYSAKIKILVGMEIDWIRDSSYSWVQALLAKYPLELFIGSVHHVHGIPIDYDQQTYVAARMVSGGHDQDLFEDYFDEQFTMLQRLKPPIIGHFDLIRLKSDDPNMEMSEHRTVWQKVERNLDFIASYAGVIELNSAALRKGMAEPYPQRSICRAFMDRGGRFTLSDDSHGVSQVGTHYDTLLAFAKEVGIHCLVFFERDSWSSSSNADRVGAVSTTLHDIQSHWRAQP